MYEEVKKENVLTELNSGTALYVVDFPTLRCMACADMLLSAVKSFVEKPEALFYKRVD